MSADEVIAMGDMEEVMRLHNDGHVWSYYDFSLSIAHGHLEITRFLIKEIDNIYLTRHDFFDSLYHSVELVDFVYTNGAKVDKNNKSDVEKAYTMAFNVGSLDNVKYLVSKGYKLTAGIFNLAVINTNNLEIIKYIYESGCPSNTDVCVNAIGDGFEWLAEKLIKENSIDMYRIRNAAFRINNVAINQVVHDYDISGWHRHDNIDSESKCYYCRNKLKKTLDEMSARDDNMVSWLTLSILEPLVPPLVISKASAHCTCHRRASPPSRRSESPRSESESCESFESVSPRH